MVRHLVISLGLLLSASALAAPPDATAGPELARPETNDVSAKKDGDGGGRRQKAAKPASKRNGAPAPARPPTTTRDTNPPAKAGGAADHTGDGAPAADRSGAERSSPAAPRGPGQPVPRTISAGAPHGASPGLGAPARGASMPANFRPPPAAAGQPGAHRGPPPAGSPAAHTAAAHHQAAAAHGPHGAAAHHEAWAHAYRASHPMRFWAYRSPVAWYPGYPHYWYHGVFVYGPPPYARSGAVVEQAGPKRVINRDDTWAVGVRGGTYASGYTNGASYSDFGMGIAVRYRPVDALGLELQWSYHDQSWDAQTARIDQPLSASVELFAFPWTRFNPYVLAGVTYTNRNVQDSIGQAFVDNDHPVWGPHLGIGLELGIGKNWSVNGDLRGVGYLNDGGEDLMRQGATQANLGVNLYF